VPRHLHLASASCRFGGSHICGQLVTPRGANFGYLPVKIPIAREFIACFKRRCLLGRQMAPCTYDEAVVDSGNALFGKASELTRDDKNGPENTRIVVAPSDPRKTALLASRVELPSRSAQYGP
jgi:hypothetical protein